MAREVFIHNSRLFKKDLSFADITSESNYEVASLGEHMTLTTSLEDESSITVLFNGECIGRGVQVVEKDKNTIHLAVNLPCTQEDIQMLYELSRRIASLWKANSIIVEDTKVAVSEIDKMVEQDVAMNKSMLADAPNLWGDYGPLTLYCATLPICVTVKQLQGYSVDYPEFSYYLHEKQKIGAFYSYPIFFSLNEELISFYVGICNGEFILPNEPQMSFKKDGVEVQCDKALIAIPNVFPDDKLSKLDYQTFVDRVPKEKLSEFDCQHMLVSSLSLEELQSIFKG